MHEVSVHHLLGERARLPDPAKPPRVQLARLSKDVLVVRAAVALQPEIESHEGQADEERGPEQGPAAGHLGVGPLGSSRPRAGAAGPRPSPESDPEAYWPTEAQCRIEAGPRAGFGAWSGWDFKGTLAHEIGHCSRVPQKI